MAVPTGGMGLSGFRFVLLLGSLRKGPFNAAITRALPALAPGGVTIELLGSVGDFPLYNADIRCEGFRPAMLVMADSIRKVDGVIVVMPEYNYSIPGVSKNAIDWLSRVPEQPVAGKRLAIQSSYPACSAKPARSTPTSKPSLP